MRCKFVLILICLSSNLIAQSVQQVGEIDVLDYYNDSYIYLGNNKVLEFGGSKSGVVYDFNYNELELINTSSFTESIDFIGVKHTDNKITGYARTTGNKWPLYQFSSDLSASKPNISVSKVESFKRRKILEPITFNKQDYFLAAEFRKPLTIYDAVLPAAVGVTALGALINVPLIAGIGGVEAFYSFISPRPKISKPYLYTLKDNKLTDVSPSVFRSKSFKNYAALDAYSYNKKFYVLLGSAVRGKKKSIALVELDKDLNVLNTKYYRGRKKVIVDYLKFTGVNEEGEIEFKGQSKPGVYNIIGQMKLKYWFSGTIRNLKGSISFKDDKLKFRARIESKKVAKQNKKRIEDNLQQELMSLAYSRDPDNLGRFNEVLSEMESHEYKNKYNYFNGKVEVGSKELSTRDTCSILGQKMMAKMVERMKPNYIEIYNVSKSGEPDGIGLESSTYASRTLLGGIYTEPELHISNLETNTNFITTFPELNFSIPDENDRINTIRHSDVMFYNKNCYVAILTSDFLLKVYLVDPTGDKFEIYSEELDDTDIRKTDEEGYNVSAALDGIDATSATFTQNPFDFTYSLGHLDDGRFILKYRKYDRNIVKPDGKIKSPLFKKKRKTMVRLYQIKD